MPRKRLEFRGLVQGVGFRPFLFHVAADLNLTGGVRNVGWGVVAEFQGEQLALDTLEEYIRSRLPVRCRLDSLHSEQVPVAVGQAGFEILPSLADPLDTVIPHDMAICGKCVEDFGSPDHRHCGNYFVSCTDCGPRYSIITSLPYDRERTVMEQFPFCPDCRHEFETPSDRRFNAQTTTCPVCGPHYRVLFPAEDARTFGSDKEIIGHAASRIRAGQVVALKGLGGFHLLCDPHREDTIRLLTVNKRREGKPMALVARRIEDVETICHVSDAEQQLFESDRSPIVLFQLKDAAFPAVNDGLGQMGIMRAYTAALHELLEACGLPFLLATSANLSGIPTIVDDKEAQEALQGVADLIVGHNRPICCRCDDSVMLAVEEHVTIRGGRGNAPLCIPRPGFDGILALGAQEKASFSFGVRGKVILSPYLGDQDTVEYQQFYRQTLEHFLNLYGFRPTRIVCDLQPDFATSRLAEELGSRWGVETLGRQHHRMHIHSAMLEHGLQETIGFAFDGTGLGDDGAVWGSEGFVAAQGTMRRAFHLDYFTLTGGAKAIRQPGLLWLALLRQLDPQAALRMEEAEPKLAMSVRAMEKMDWPRTSSMGRLFDVAGVILGCGQDARYEAMLPMRLEAMADAGETGAYGISFRNGDALTVDPLELLACVYGDVKQGTPRPVAAARFHNTVCSMLTEAADRLRKESGLNSVTLAGGVFQNRYLLTRALAQLKRKGFEVCHPCLVPINDGGISVGQVHSAGWSKD